MTPDTTQTDRSGPGRVEPAVSDVERLRAEHLAGLRELQAGRDRVLDRVKAWTLSRCGPEEKP